MCGRSIHRQNTLQFSAMISKRIRNRKRLYSVFIATDYSIIYVVRISPPFSNWNSPRLNYTNYALFCVHLYINFERICIQIEFIDESTRSWRNHLKCSTYRMYRDIQLNFRCDGLEEHRFQLSGVHFQIFINDPNHTKDGQRQQSLSLSRFPCCPYIGGAKPNSMEICI